MKIRVLVDNASNYNSIVIDTDDLYSTCIDRSNGRICLFKSFEGSSLFKDTLPTIFISDLINELIDKN